MAADCQAAVAGAVCGVLAVGRCRACGLAFCRSHQAELWTNVVPNTNETISDLCRACHRAEEAEHAAGVVAREAARLFGHQSHRAVEALRSSGVRKVHLHIERGTTTTGAGTGWVLGEFEWRYPYDAERDEYGPWLTVLCDRDDRQDLERVVRIDDTNYLVRPHGTLAGGVNGYDEVERVIRRLAGLP
jgi:hypothetical protein